MKRKISLRVPPAKEGQVLEKVLREELGFTRKQISRMKFKEDGILVNGHRERVTYRVKSQDLVQVLLEDGWGGSHHLIPSEGEPDIVYEDEDMVIVNKPSGMVLHPAGRHYQDSMANLLAGYYRQKGQPMTIRFIGRLDKDTSGLMVCAKNQIAASRLWKQKANGEFQKEYISLVEGEIKEPWGTITKPIGEDLTRHAKMCIREDGKPAVTHYKVKQYCQGVSLVKVRIETGRTHQIRVHMAAMGHPLLGDSLYGGNTQFIERAALHAGKIRLCQPITGEELEVRTALPEDMEAICLNVFL